jgi:hypothetical protein
METVIAMEKKYLAVLLSFLLVLGGLTLIPWSLAQEAENEEEGAPPRPMKGCRMRLLRLILTRGKATTLEGELLLVEGHILALEVDGDVVYVILPYKWLVDGEVMTLEELFDGDPIGEGDAIVIYALMVSYEAETHTIELYVAYEIEGGEVEAKAITPLNIRVG